MLALLSVPCAMVSNKEAPLLPEGQLACVAIEPYWNEVTHKPASQ